MIIATCLCRAGKGAFWGCPATRNRWPLSQLDFEVIYRDRKQTGEKALPANWANPTPFAGYLLHRLGCRANTGHRDASVDR